MMNNRLVNKSVELVKNFNEANYINFNIKEVRAQVEEWYCNSDIADAEILAAAVIAYGYYTPVDYDKILRQKDYYFPEVPVECDNYHIGEIEAAMRDMQWI